MSPNVSAKCVVLFYISVCLVCVEWPCNAYLQHGPAELASPRWPLHYVANLHCTWRISAPAQHRVRLDVTDFSLDRDRLGHCTDQQDHVRLLDGGTLSARVVGMYCGEMAAFTVMSTERDMIVQFSSDRHTSHDDVYQYNDSSTVEYVRRGFHAVFSFQPQNSSSAVSTDDANRDSSRYIDVGGQARDWNVDLDYVDDSQGNNVHLVHSDSSSVTRR